MCKDIMRYLSILMIGIPVLLTGCGETPPEPVQTAEQTAAATEASTVQSVTELPAVHSFSAATVSGTEFTQEDLAKADVTVINIWQTTCGPCIAEMPELAELEASLPENVQLVTWCLDGPHNPELAERILEESGFGGVTLTGAGEGDLPTMLRQVMYTPTTVFLDSEGNHMIPEMIGSPEHPADAYRDAINTALRTIGKDELPA